MSTMINIQMDEAEAAQCVEGIRTALKASAFHFEQGQKYYDKSRELLWKLHEYRGWEALGYSSWRACVEAEFKAKKDILYKRLAAAAVEQQVSPLSPIGSIPERVLRPLANKKYTEETRKALFEIASGIAGSPSSVTSGLMQSVVETLGEAIATGTLSDSEGNQTPIYQRFTEDVLARTVERNKRHREHLQTGAGVKIVSAAEIRPHLSSNQFSFELTDSLTKDQIKMLSSGRYKLKVTIWGAD